VECEAASDEVLFADWLNALVYEMAVRQMIFGRFEVRIDGARLRIGPRSMRGAAGAVQSGHELSG